MNISRVLISIQRCVLVGVLRSILSPHSHTHTHTHTPKNGKFKIGFL